MYYKFVSVEDLDGQKISYEYIKNKSFVTNALKNEEVITLKELTKEVTNGVRIKTEYYSDQGVKVIGPGDIKGDIIVFDSLKIIRSEVVNVKDMISKGDILITAVGRSGKVIYIDNDIENTAITSDIIKITLENVNESKLLEKFLRCKIGQSIINMEKGSRSNRLLVKNIENMIVPKLFNKYIETTIKENDFNIKAYEDLKKAENLFSKYVEYKEENNSIKCFMINEELNEERLDYDYYANLKTSLFKLINTDRKEVRWQRIGEVIEIKKTYKPIIDDKSKVTYFTLSDIDYVLSIVKETHKEAYGNLSNRMRNVVYEGEIVTAKSGSATGTKSHATAIITKELDGSITSDALFNIVPKAINRYYLLFLLKQDIIINQIKMISKGSTYKLVQKEQFENIRIPRLREDVENSIIKYIKSYIENIRGRG